MCSSDLLYDHADLKSEKLLRPQRRHRVALGRFSGRDQSTQKREKDAQRDQDDCVSGGQERIDVVSACQVMDQRIAGDQQKYL